MLAQCSGVDFSLVLERPFGVNCRVCGDEGRIVSVCKLRLAGIGYNVARCCDGARTGARMHPMAWTS
jgi:hypothetical protein